MCAGHNPHYPIAIVVSTSEVCLVKTNHQWPSPQHQAPVTAETVGKQFTVLERQKINNIATVVSVCQELGHLQKINNIATVMCVCQELGRLQKIDNISGHCYVYVCQELGQLQKVNSIATVMCVSCQELGQLQKVNSIATVVCVVSGTGLVTEGQQYSHCCVCVSGTGSVTEGQQYSHCYVCLSGTGSFTKDQQYSHCGECVCQDLGQLQKIKIATVVSVCVRN